MNSYSSSWRSLGILSPRLATHWNRSCRLSKRHSGVGIVCRCRHLQGTSSMSSWVDTYHSLRSGHRHRTDTETWCRHTSDKSCHRPHMTPLLSQKTLWNKSGDLWTHREWSRIPSKRRIWNHLLWAVWPALPLVEKQFIAALGTAHAVIAGVYAWFTVWGALLTQPSARVCIGSRWTLHDTRAVLVQEIPWGTAMHNNSNGQ